MEHVFTMANLKLKPSLFMPRPIIHRHVHVLLGKTLHFAMWSCVIGQETLSMLTLPRGTRVIGQDT